MARELTIFIDARLLDDLKTAVGVIEDAIETNEGSEHYFETLEEETDYAACTTDMGYAKDRLVRLSSAVEAAIAQTL